jgi:hypothetical protein
MTPGPCCRPKEKARRDEEEFIMRHDTSGVHYFVERD